MSAHPQPRYRDDGTLRAWPAGIGRGGDADLRAAEARADRKRCGRGERAPYRGAQQDRSGLVDAAWRGMQERGRGR